MGGPPCSRASGYEMPSRYSLWPPEKLTLPVFQARGPEWAVIRNPALVSPRPAGLTDCGLCVVQNVMIPKPSAYTTRLRCATRLPPEPRAGEGCGALGTTSPGAGERRGPIQALHTGSLVCHQASPHLSPPRCRVPKTVMKMWPTDGFTSPRPVPSNYSAPY